MFESVEIPINTDSIRLDQFLKWANITNSGGQAKQLVQTGMVKVNGFIETRRGKILLPGDKVEIANYGDFTVVRSS